MPTKIKLIKIASEINISKDTIVDFLRSKGVEIENKPTATLDEAMQALVFEKFKKEKINAEKQREKLLKQKERKPVSKTEIVSDRSLFDAEPAITEQPVADTPPVISIESAKDVVNDNIIIKPAAQKPKVVYSESIPEVGNVIELPEISVRKTAEKTKKEGTESAEKPKRTSKKSKKEEASDVATIGDIPIIKIESAKQLTTANKKKKTAKENTGEKEIAQDVAVAEVVPMQEDTEHEVRHDKPEHEAEAVEIPMPAVERVEAEAPPAPKQQEEREHSTENADIVADDQEIEESDDDDASKDPAKKKRKKKKLIEIHQPDDKRPQIDKRMPGEKMHLKGLTVLGKIELEKEKAAREERAFKRRDFKSDRPQQQQGGYRRRFDENQRGGYREARPDNRPDNRPPYYRDRNAADAKDKDRKFVKKDGQGHYTAGGDKKFRQDSPSPNANRPQNAQRTGYVHQAGGGAKPKVFSSPTLPPKDAKKPGFKGTHDDKKKKGKSIREMITQEEVDKAIRQTLSGMEDNFSNAKKAKIKQKKKAILAEKEARLQERTERESRILRLTEFVTTSDLANLMNIKPNDVILKCMQLGLMVTINQRLDKDTLLLIADDYGFQTEFIEEDAGNDIEEIVDTPESLQPRPPIVTIMGHVDHGKTSLLDHIRNANVVAGEAGGITQHIGAYRVILKNGKSITFLDTPGHEAFTAMRARGAQVTDIVVLVVAADDSVMPQTIEAISHARAANVPIVVAINKIDKSEANPDRIRQQLSDHGILVEDWGGKNQCAEISAKKGLNVDMLLDKILLEAEMLELKANPNRNAVGIVIESKMTKGWGNVATIVVQNGTLNLGDAFVAGANSGKTRALLDERGNKVSDVLPSQPVVVIGFDGLPEAGDTFNAMASELEAKAVATKRKQLRREQEMRKVRHTTLDDISAQISIGGVKDLNLVIKGDVAGSVEALSDSLLKLSTEEVRVNILHKGAGAITESDIMLASASSAVVIGFNVSATPQAAKLAELEEIDVRHYDIIYDCINEIHLALEGMLKPDIKEEILATVEVRKIFKISRIGQIAGCYVLSGKISRNDKIRVLRNGLPVYTGSLTSLKRNKDDVREIDQNYECGIQIDNFNSFEEHDIIEAYKLVEVKRTLSH